MALAAFALTGLSACAGDEDGATDTAARTTTPPSVPQATTNAGGAIAWTTEAPEPPSDPKVYDSPPPGVVIDEALAYSATLGTSCGEIVLALDTEGAPDMVDDFAFLAEAPATTRHPAPRPLRLDVAYVDRTPPRLTHLAASR